MDPFEKLLLEHRGAVERYVRFRLSSQADAEDVLQEVYLTAYRKFHRLRDRSCFKPWLISIARNKCADYFRARGRSAEVPLEEVPESLLLYGRAGRVPSTPVEETLEQLGDREREILRLYFWEELPQADIARRLGIPVGTVKSRLHTAKRSFKNHYPNQPACQKGENGMKMLPEYLPQYTIKEKKEAPFPVKWEELIGWFLIPRLGEKLSWGMYDIPSRKRDHVYDMAVTGRVMIHGIEGVEITAREAEYSDQEDTIERTFAAQLTDTHCRCLAALRTENGVRHYITFLDGEEFAATWGFGENNCGNETNLSPKGDITRVGNAVTCKDKEFLLDVVGRYEVAVGGNRYDTVCVMLVDDGVFSEQFVDENGRTVLWRRFNRDDWAIDRMGGKLWSEQLPDNHRVTVNGETYVHWYDCITDYIL